MALLLSEEDLPSNGLGWKWGQESNRGSGDPIKIHGGMGIKLGVWGPHKDPRGDIWGQGGLGTP